MRQILTLISAAALAFVGAACGTGGDDADEPAADTASGAATDATVAPGSAGTESGDVPDVVVTTTILGDVVAEVVGDLADVEVIMPVGADPHDFAPSVRQAEAMERADLLVVNGAGFEEGMLGAIDAVADGGTPVYAFADAMELVEGGHDHHDEDDHDGDDHDGEDDHDGGYDPHVWTDPARMIDGVRGLGDALAAVDGIDAEVLAGQADAYVAELEQLDGEIETSLDAVPDDQRVLVTNHESFGYFADRYRFEVIGTVIPSLTTSAETSVRELEELAELISDVGVPAIFTETTQSSDLADALADEVGGNVEVVKLYSGSLGEAGSGAETYLGVMRTNAERIAAALGT